ncbi:MAG: PEGA domain-containing protein, partial [Spirochaetales bacterium]|nr:PEGA domain-containing protein [Spirochaetales bacterium]
MLLILFLVAVLPDIIDAHKRVTFTSDSGTVAVYLDDVYQGGTPFTRKIKSGTHQVSYRLNGYEIDSFSIKVGTPVFFNWLFPRTQSVSSSATINQEAFDAVSLELLEKANAYSAILEYDSVHRYPGIFTKYADNVANSTFRTSGDTFEAASLFITTDEMLKDFENAASIIGINLLPLYKTLDENKTTGVQDAETPI